MTTPHPNQTDTRLAGAAHFTVNAVVSLSVDDGRPARWVVRGTVESVGDSREGHARVLHRELRGFGALPGLAADDFIVRATAVRAAVALFRQKEAEEDTLVAGLETHFADPPPPSD